jgi:sugar phosphate isomerase/epimerase
LLEDIERAGPCNFGVDLNDAVSDDDQMIRLPGEGKIPLTQVVRAIEATGYRGTYDSEYMYEPALITARPEEFTPEVVVRRCAEAMVNVLDGNIAL